MSYQLYPATLRPALYVQMYSCIRPGRAFLEYAGLPSPKTVCVPRFHKAQAGAACRCPSQTSEEWAEPQSTERRCFWLRAIGVRPSPLGFVRTPSDFIWLSGIRLACRDVWIFRRIRRFFDRNQRRFRGCAKSGRSRHSKCHDNQMPKPSQRKLPVHPSSPSSMSSSVQPPPVL